MDPGTSPRVLETLAVIGGTPTASRVGNVINVPDPTTALMAPAATPASRTATICRNVTGPAAPRARRPPHRWQRRESRASSDGSTPRGGGWGGAPWYGCAGRGGRAG